MNDKQKYVDCLNAIKEVFNRNDIDYWLDYGTLWGAIRDNAIMEFDNDVDVGVWLSDVPKISQTKREFRELGYDLRVNPNHLNYVVHDLYTGEHLGCILFRTIVDGYAIRIHFKPWCKILKLAKYGSGGWLIKTAWKIIISLAWYDDMEVSGKWEHMDGFRTIYFYNKYHKIPCHAKDYLDWMYPYRDWRIVAKKPLHGAEIGRRRQRLKEILK